MHAVIIRSQPLLHYCKTLVLGSATFPAALDEEPISHLHDVGFVHSCHLVPIVVSSILEGILSHSCAGNPRDNLQHAKTCWSCCWCLPMLR